MPDKQGAAPPGDRLNFSTVQIAIDNDANKWFGGGGVVKFDGTSWTAYSTTDGLISISVFFVAIDYDNNKWFGTYSGVSEFDDTNWTTYTTTDGLATNSVKSIAIDNDGVKWFATDGGVSKMVKIIPGDINQDQNTDLEDVISILKLVSGSPQPVHLSADVNQDDKIGTEEALYIMHYLSSNP